MTHADGRPGDNAPPSEMKKTIEKKRKSCQPHTKFMGEEKMSNGGANKERKRKKKPLNTSPYNIHKYITSGTTS